MVESTHREHCRNLYNFIRFRLGPEISDREIARRWGLEWRSFSLLKQGRRQVPRIADLERLAPILDVDVAFVCEVARGLPAERVHRLLQANDRDQLVSLLMTRVAAAHQQAESSEDRFSFLVDRIGDGVLAADLSGRFRNVNEAFCRISGYTRAELLELALVDVVPPGRRVDLLDHFARAVREGEVRNVEMVLRTKSGEDRDVLGSGVRMDDADGNPVGVQAFFQDVTERKVLEHERLLNKNIHGALLEAIPDLIFRISMTGEYLEIIPGRTLSPVAPPEFLLGKNIADVLPRDLVVALLRCFEESSRTGRVQYHRYALPFVAGGEQSFEARIVPLSANEVLVISRDVTDEIEDKQALDNEIGELRSVLNAIPAACLLIDSAGRIVYANQDALSSDATGEENWVGRSLSDFVSDGASVALQALASGRIETSLVRRVEGGVERYMHATAAPILGAGNRVERVIEISVDVTEQCVKKDQSTRARAAV